MWDSAVCQILLEGCLPVAALGDDKEPGPLLEARNLICATITTLLHTSPLLLKLLHFQVCRIFELFDSFVF